MATQKVADITVQKVSDLTVAEFRELIREVVAQSLAELVEDPDAGLELREEFVAELLQAAKEARAAGQLTIPDEQIAEMEEIVSEHGPD